MSNIEPDRFQTFNIQQFLSEKIDEAITDQESAQRRSCQI